MKIDKGIETPKETRGRKQGNAKYKYPFGEMSIGDSFLMNYGERMSVYSCLVDYNLRNKTSIKIKTAKIGEDQYRCWRISEEK